MGRRAADPNSPHEEQGLLVSSSEHLLLTQDVRDVNKSDNFVSTPCARSNPRWAQVQKTGNHSRLKESNTCNTSDRPRWMTTRRDFYDDEKSMRGLGRRCAARLGLGTLIFL